MPTAVIIGGGPAGSMAGILLARAGWQVSLIEQHRFPREKVCGECLSPLALEVLHRSGLLPTIRAAGATQLRHFAVYAGHRSVQTSLNQLMLGLSRGRFDDILLDAAKEAGVTVHQPARCQSISGEADQCELQIRDLAANRVFMLNASHVLLADGKGALLPSRAPTTGDFGIKAHFTNVAAGREAIELFSTCGRYGGVAPIEGDRWNAAFSVKASDLAACHGDIDRLFAGLCSGNHFLAERFASAERCGEWLASPLPRFAVRRRWPAGVIPLGNAAAALEPIGGEGMGLALRSAELVCEFLLAGSLHDRARLQRRFENLWSLRRIACRSAACLIASPIFGSPAVALLASSQSLGRLAMRLTGKPRYSSISQSLMSDAS
jgi:2-polyprenyl-6-methoxyphenol hydroxylase-like FAD-dependent oxidoreductase